MTNWSWGIPASVLLHVALGALFFIHLPPDLAEPPSEESVSVQIVPPPEEKPEEAKKEEAPPQPEEKQEPQKQEASEPPPQAEEPASDKESKPAPIPALQPVIEYGEKDSGPRLSDQGKATQDAAESAEAPAENPKTSPATETAEKADTASPVSTPPLPDDVNVPEVAQPPSAPEPDGQAQAPSADTARLELVNPPVAEPKPIETEQQAKPSGLPKAEKLFSTDVTDDPVAMRAMKNLPKGVRAGQLCATELRQQLFNASPPYLAEYLPASDTIKGTVLDVRKAFRASGQWYDLSFRCELNAEITKVVSFAFAVGDPIPRSKWRKRGFPAD